MRQTALVDLPEKRLQESGEALGERINDINKGEARSALPMLRDANVGVPDVPLSERTGTLYIQMDGGRLNTTTEGWREPKAHGPISPSDHVRCQKRTTSGIGQMQQRNRETGISCSGATTKYSW